MSVRRKWTLEENKKILELHNNGMSYADIGKLFDSTRIKIYCHVKYMKNNDINRRHNREWTKEEFEILYKNVGRKNVPAIAKEINRKATAVYYMMDKIGLTNIKDCTYKITLNQLAKIIKIDNRAIKRWIDTGLLKAKYKALLFTGKCYFIDINDFWKFAEKNKSLLNFKKIERKALIPEPNWLDDAVKNETKRKKHRDIWTNEEDIQLQALFYKLLSYDEIARIMNRTYSSIAHRINRLCLTKFKIKRQNEVNNEYKAN